MSIYMISYAPSGPKHSFLTPATVVEVIEMAPSVHLCICSLKNTLMGCTNIISALGYEDSHAIFLDGNGEQSVFFCMCLLQ